MLAERKEAIGIATNNVAEYRGLIAGLEAAVDLRAEDVVVQMDSKLVVEQMSGRWKVKRAMAELHQRARALASNFSTIAYRWIPREKNKHADRLANEAMDAAAGIEAAQPVQAAAARQGAVAVPPSAWTETKARQHDSCCCAMDRPSCRSSGAIRAGEIRNSLNWVAVRPTRPRAISRGAVASQRSSHRRCSELRTRRDVAADALGRDFTVDDDLIETDFGAWEGLTFAEAAERDPDLHGDWLRDTSLRPPGGESFADVSLRVQRVRDRIIAEHAGSTVLVVSHVTPIKTLLQLALDVGSGILHRLHLDLASLSIAEFYPDGGSSVRLVNQTSYLW